MPTLVHLPAGDAASMSPIFECGVIPVASSAGTFTYRLDAKTYTIAGLAISVNVDADEMARVKTAIQAVWKTKDEATISVDKIAAKGETQHLSVS